MDNRDYFNSPSFEIHRKKINNLISSIPYQESPYGWIKGCRFAVSDLEYIGFSDDSHYLLVASSSGRGIIDLSTREIVARDRTTDGEWLNESCLLCQGIGPLAGKTVRITGIGGGGLPTITPYGESLYLAASLYPCYDVIYEPHFQSCLNDKNNKDCVNLYRGFVDYCGFSWDGNTMVVVDEDIHIWYREKE